MVRSIGRCLTEGCNILFKFKKSVRTPMKVEVQPLFEGTGPSRTTSFNTFTLRRSVNPLILWGGGGRLSSFSILFQCGISTVVEYGEVGEDVHNING